MSFLSEYVEATIAFNEEHSQYVNRPTKASSARLRKLTNTLSNLGVKVRKELIANDKK